MTPRPTPLLGFREPTVKGAELTLPVLTANGEWSALVATVRDWRLAIALVEDALTRAQEQASGTAVAAHGPAERGPVTKPGGRLL